METLYRKADSPAALMKPALTASASRAAAAAIACSHVSNHAARLNDCNALVITRGGEVTGGARELEEPGNELDSQIIPAKSGRPCGTWRRFGKAAERRAKLGNRPLVG